MNYLKRLISFLVFLSSFIQVANAQSLSLSGQYGCILNRNYAGFSTLSGSVKGSGITASNFMLYLDFSAKTSRASVVGVINWGTSTVQTTAVAGDIGTLMVANGPITNSFLVTVKENSGTVTFLMMPTNGGNNLLVQSGIAGTDDGQPSTGVCNKI